MINIQKDEQTRKKVQYNQQHNANYKNKSSLFYFFSNTHFNQ